MARTTPHPPDRPTPGTARLFIEECDTVALLERLGSPLFVFSEAQLRDNFRRFRDAFAEDRPNGPIDVMPAMKAPDPPGGGLFPPRRLGPRQWSG